MKKNVTLILLMLAVFGLPLSCPVKAGQVEKAIEKPVHQAVQVEQQTQAGQVKWRREKEEKIQQFQELETKLAALKKEDARETELNQALNRKVAQKEKALRDIARMEAEISPFLDGILEGLQRLRARDLPFLVEERDNRLNILGALNADPEVPVSEKFRKLMEALMIEAEYGQTVEVYQETVDLAGEPTLVNIFRLGRLRLYYQTLDKQHCGYYNLADKSWAPLDKRYLPVIQAAVDMGSKRRPVELVDLPLGRLVIQ